jgi:hypothetical protein
MSLPLPPFPKTDNIWIQIVLFVISAGGLAKLVPVLVERIKAKQAREDAVANQKALREKLELETEVARNSQNLASDAARDKLIMDTYSSLLAEVKTQTARAAESEERAKAFERDNAMLRKQIEELLKRGGSH